MRIEKRFFTKINKNGTLVIIDKECHVEIIDMTLACEVLNRLDLKLKTYNEQIGEQQDTIITLKRRLEKINGGYGYLTHRNGLTANEWVIESQERELKKKNEQIKCLKEEREQLQKKNKGLGDDLYNCRANKNIISKVLKLWRNTLAEYDIYTIKDFKKSFELDAKINKEKDEKIKELEVKVLNLELELMKYE